MDILWKSVFKMKFVIFETEDTSIINTQEMENANIFSIDNVYCKKNILKTMIIQ